MPAQSFAEASTEEADRMIREYDVNGAPEAIETLADGLQISLPVVGESASFERDVIASLRQRAREAAPLHRPS